MRAAGLVSLAMLAAACTSGSFKDNVYRDSHTAYRVGLLGPSWHRFDLSGGNLAFHHEQGGSIYANATCKGINDVPLDVLTNQALFDVERKHELGRERFTLDGRVALRTRLTGSVDGVEVELELVVMKKDNCVYDLQLVAGGQIFAEREADFGRFVDGFQQLPRAN
jgi:hypothetical protein